MVHRFNEDNEYKQFNGEKTSLVSRFILDQTKLICSMDFASVNTIRIRTEGALSTNICRFMQPRKAHTSWEIFSFLEELKTGTGGHFLEVPQKLNTYKSPGMSDDSSMKKSIKLNNCNYSC